MSEHEALRIQNAYKEVFGSPLGKVVLEHLFANLKMDQTTFVEGDPYTSAYNEGRRSVYMEILRHSELDLTPFMQKALKYQR